ncbi:MAG: tetratricopeptide repeat protein [Parvibaculum sp.]
MTTEQTEALALPERYKEVLSLMKEGRRKIAEERCRELLASEPDDADAMALLASVIVERGEFEEAEKLLRQSLKLVPTRAVPWVNLGRLLQQTGQWGEAVEVYEHAANLFPDHPQIAATLGQLYQRANRFAEAETQYRTAIENGGRPALYVQLGMVLLRQERTDEAVEAFQTAISFNPKLAAAYGNLGNAEQKRGNMEAAAAAYERACELNPKDTLSFVSMGMAQLKLGQAREAAEVFERALGLHGPERRAAAWLPYARAQEFGEMPAGYRAEIGNLVVRATLTPPDGYASMKEFNEALAEALAEDPTTVWEPTGKATRKGGQTGLLLDTPREPFIAFEKSLRRAIDAHFDTIRKEPRHPYRSQVPKTYHLDLWGTLLSEGGHQHSHIHVGGWMSGVYYVALPPTLGTGENGKDGWIEFGHPPPEFEANFEPQTVTYEPREGDALFFPSYLFHRTLPFTGDVRRISLAFDVKPTSWR